MKKIILVLLCVFLMSCTNTIDTVPDTGVNVPSAPEVPDVPTVSDTITFGFIGPLTGDIAFIGEAEKKAVELAVEKINSADGIGGKKLNIIFEDGKCNGKDAATAANKLVNADKVKYIVGGACSSETLAAAPIAEEAGVVLLSTISSSPDVTTAGDYVFRVYPSDLFQGKTAAEYVFNDLGKKKVAVMSCLSDWCAGLNKVFIETFESLGGEIVSNQQFQQGATDLKTELTKVKQGNPELIYLVAYTDATVTALRQSSQLGIKVPFLGADGWDDATIWERTKGFSDGTQYLVPDTPAPESFKESWKLKYDEEGDLPVGAVQSYDAVYLLKKVIEEVGDSPEAVKDALYQIKGYEGASGIIGFDENGDLLEASYAIKEVKDGVATKIA